MEQRYAIEANRVFLLSIIVSQALLYAVVGLGVRDAMVRQFLMEAFIALPGVGYMFGQRQSVKSALGINRLSLKQWLLLIPLAVCVDKIAQFINVVSQLFTPNLVGSHMTELILRYPLPAAFFVIAVMPAVCEELIFRGILYRNYRKYKVWIAVVLSGFLFGIMHMNLNQFFYAFALGLAFALVNEITGSFLPSVFLHLYVNGRSVVVLYTAVNYLERLREQYIAAEAAGDTGLMERLLQAAQGVPVDSENWLDAYLNMGSGTVPEAIAALLPVFLAALAGAIVVVRLLIRGSGYKGGFAKGKEETGKEERGGWTAVFSPSLLIGVLICIAFMFGK